MIYIATTPPNASAAHPAFKQRSISNLTAVQPSTITILGVPHAKELAYTGYKDNIDMFISATNRQQKLRTDAPGAILNFNRPTLSIPMPVIDYIPMQQLSSDQIEKLLQKFKEMDPIKKVIAKPPTYTYPTQILLLLFDSSNRRYRILFLLPTSSHQGISSQFPS